MGNSMSKNYYDKQKYARNFFEMLTEHFWFHDEPDIRNSFQAYTRFREREEGKHAGGAPRESVELLKKEQKFASLLQGLDIIAYQLWHKSMEQSHVVAPRNS